MSGAQKQKVLPSAELHIVSVAVQSEPSVTVVAQVVGAKSQTVMSHSSWSFVQVQL